ncbi:MAG: glycosyltransferase family 2 protein [Candidatus Wallbacteria bacterium]|nr:glycosyltransferase family 2 protein [Candidatus Wallbacteria bacterium]
MNWNGLPDTVECLESALKQSYRNYQIILVENGSTDGSYEKILEYFKGHLDCGFLSSSPHKDKIFPLSEKPLDFIECRGQQDSGQRVVLIRNEINQGWSAGFKTGLDFFLKKNDGDYLLVLNNDVVIEADYLGKLVETAVRNPDFGVIGSIAYWYEYPERIMSVGGEFTFADWQLYTDLSDLKRKAEMSFPNEYLVSVLTGCSMFFQKKSFSVVGPTPVYYHFWEDLELYYRLRNAGFGLILNTDARLWHKGGTAENYHQGPTKFSSYYGIRNKFIFAKRNLGILEKSYIYTVFAAKMMIRVFFYRISKEVKQGMLRGVLDGFRGVTGKIDLKN